MAKGYKGETCAEAILSSIQPGEIISYSVLFARVREKGDWKDDTLHQHFMSCVANLPPARDRWAYRDPFLFLHEDGRYELYDPKIHPPIA